MVVISDGGAGDGGHRIIQLGECVCLRVRLRVCCTMFTCIVFYIELDSAAQEARGEQEPRPQVVYCWLLL